VWPFQYPIYRDNRLSRSVGRQYVLIGEPLRTGFCIYHGDKVAKRGRKAVREAVREARDCERGGVDKPLDCLYSRGSVVA
jgi:hypothetical protein